MGTPVKCPEAGIILNGLFDTTEFWGITAGWQIHNGYADYGNVGFQPGVWLYQHTNLVIGQTYVIDFDILEIIVTGATHLDMVFGGIGASFGGPYTTPGHKRAVLVFDSVTQWLSFQVTVANVDYRYIKIDNVVCSTLETFIACALAFANLPNTNFEWYDLGGGIYHVLYADTSGITKLLAKIDINDF